MRKVTIGFRLWSIHSATGRGTEMTTRSIEEPSALVGKRHDLKQMLFRFNYATSFFFFFFFFFFGKARSIKRCQATFQFPKHSLKSC